jgi:EAL domain-containing protein (putative c-di-GMP-specific phosphodiesterase class I)
MLTAEGCTHAQGFHVSRPVPASRIESLLIEQGTIAAGKERAAG